MFDDGRPEAGVEQRADGVSPLGTGPERAQRLVDELVDRALHPLVAFGGGPQLVPRVAHVQKGAGSRAIERRHLADQALDPLATGARSAEARPDLLMIGQAEHREELLAATGSPGRARYAATTGPVLLSYLLSFTGHFKEPDKQGQRDALVDAWTFKRWLMGDDDAAVGGRSRVPGRADRESHRRLILARYALLAAECKPLCLDI